jgi:anti-sigma B factor antagonist
MRLEIQSRVVGEVLVVNCRGRIVAGDASQALHDHLKEAMPETPDVVLQLGQVSFIDSSGLGTLVRLMTYARSRGGDVKLCAIPEFISKTLRLTSLNKVFESHGSEAEAIAACYQRRQTKQSETAHPSQTVLCFEESADVLAFVRELLRHAGYRVLTTSLLPDAQVLLRATRPSLIVLGPRTANACGRNIKELFGQIAPSVPLCVLEEDFCTRDPGEAGALLLERVHEILPA